MRARCLSSADAAALLVLDQRCFPPGIAYLPGRTQAALERPGGYGCGVEQGGALAAFMLMQCERGWGLRHHH
ncbi:MAG: hypothetical protein ACRD01_10140 [Terriglobales bacterium]